MKRFILKSPIRSFRKISLMAGSLFIFFFCIPLDTAQIFGQFSILRFVALLPIVVGILNIKRLRIRKNPASILLALYITLMAVTLPYSYSLGDSIVEFITYLMYGSLVFFATSFKYNDSEKKLIMAGLVSSSVMALVLLVFFPYNYEGRLTILVNPMMNEDPNHFSGYLIPGLLFMIYGLFRGGRLRILAVLAAIIFVYAMLLTGSRGGVLAALLGAVILIWLEVMRRSSTILGAIVKTASILIILLVVVSQLAMHLSPDLVDRFTIDNVVSTGGTGREDIWRESFSLWSHASVTRQAFGYGIGTIATMTGTVAHNSWVEVVFEMGIVGLIIYILMMASVAFMLHKARNTLGLATFVAFIGLTMSLSLFSYKPIWAIFIVAIIYYISCVTKNSDRKETR